MSPRSSSLLGASYSPVRNVNKRATEVDPTTGDQKSKSPRSQGSMDEEETALVAVAPKRQATLDLSAVAEDRGDIRMSTNGENLRNQLGLVATISPSMETCEGDNELQKANGIK